MQPPLLRVLLLLRMFFLCSTFQNLPPFITSIRMHASYASLDERSFIAAYDYVYGDTKAIANTSCNPNNACVDKVT